MINGSEEQVRNLRGEFRRGVYQTALQMRVDAAEATVSVGVREMCSRLNTGARSFARAAENLARTAQLRNKEFKAVTFYDQEMEHRLVSVTRGDCQAAGRLMRRDARRIGFGSADYQVGNIDGGPWIIGQIVPGVFR